MIHLPSSKPLTSGLRQAPRVRVAGLCNEVADDDRGDHHASILDVSPDGLRIERPHRGGLIVDRVALEFEVDEVDEVMWALGEVCFDHVHRVESGDSTRLVRTTGLRIRAAASRHLRLLRDYVMARTEKRRRPMVHAEVRWTPTLAWATPCRD